MRELKIPQGLHRCYLCGEYKGKIFEQGEGWLIVSCICDGILCPLCGKNKIRKPITNYYDVDNSIIHVSYPRSCCDSCQRKKSKISSIKLLNGAAANSEDNTIRCPDCKADIKVENLMVHFPNRVSHDMTPGWLTQCMEYWCPHCWLSLGESWNNLIT